MEFKGGIFLISLQKILTDRQEIRVCQDAVQKLICLQKVRKGTENDKLENI